MGQWLDGRRLREPDCLSVQRGGALHRPRTGLAAYVFPTEPFALVTSEFAESGIWNVVTTAVAVIRHRLHYDVC
jgi:hypothetical protein